MANLTVRNVTCDYYMEKPNGFNRPQLHTNSRVPIIRMFGILRTGQKCCVHIHGVFPYIIIRTGIPFTPEYGTLLRNRIGAIVLENNQRRKFNADFSIYAIKPISVKSMYGYYESVGNFVQILFYSPLQLKIVADALQKETKRNAIFQVYESHVPYILQFFIDYSVFGMDLVNFRAVKFRVSPQRAFSELYYGDLTVENIVNDIELVSPLLPSTAVAIECDVFAANIDNAVLHSASEISSNPGLNYIWKDEQRRCQKRGKELIAESSQEERSAPDTAKEHDYLRRLRAFAKSFDSAVSCSTMENEASHVAEEGIRNVDESDALGDDVFGAADVNIFDEELFLEGEDEIQKMGGDEQEIQEDIDWRQKVGILCAAPKSTYATELVELSSNDSDNDEDDAGDEFVVGEAIPSTSGFSNLQQTSEAPKKSSQGSANSGDLFDSDSRSVSTRITSTHTFADSGHDLLSSRTPSQQYSHRTFSSKTSQTSASSGTTRKRTADQLSLSELDSCWLENEEASCPENYETDIENIWIPKRPQKSVFSEDTEAMCSRTEIWLRPRQRLPLQKRIDPWDEIKQTLPAADEFVEYADQQKKTVEQLFTESYIEQPSFITYENVKENLERTLIAPSRTLQSEETEQTDIRHLCVMGMEILALVSPGMPVPDPQNDEIVGIFYTVSTDVCAQDDSDVDGAILNMDNALIGQNRLYTYVATEVDLFDAFVNVIRRYDPDIVIGYSTQRYSWGYLVERSLVIGRNLLSEISRCPIDINDYYRPGQHKKNRWLKELDPTPRGRILINVWRILRFEVPLRNYTMSSAVDSVLKRRFPEYNFRTLSEWMISSQKDLIFLVLEYMRQYCKLNIRILERLDLFTKTSEMARLYGIQFNEVLTRGSQFRVESMLLRLAHREKFVAPSISPVQRAAMCSPETLPLTMEPESGFYRDPVIVLDFQSLYPSIIIAYNYCFTTCFGKVLNIENIAPTGTAIELGGVEYCCPIGDIVSFLTRNALHISPAGAVFCRKSIRRGLMPVMLEEILNTRVMVKKAVKEYNKNRRLTRILDARQMALKLIANVTYGYAAANFSGRMPCVEVADAIVSKGRETLERAMELVGKGTYGSARVIYGDTDSMFVLCPGSTRAEAFEIGKKIADDVTNANPRPVKLKLEKIMHPLILESKKRYVGMSYENINDAEGVFDAKGIETVRRDSCPLVSRILEKALRLLFDGSMNRVVRYLDMQLSNLSQLPLSDFVFSREYRKSYAEAAVVASKLIAQKRILACPRNEPEVGERVPYVIVSGEPHSTLISCVREPWEFLADHRLTLNFDYYVQRQLLPSLQRAFDYVPLKMEWHCPTTMGCYKCGALGVRLWCKECITDRRALLQALCDYQRERHLLARLSEKCRRCLAFRSIAIDYNKCVNMACMVKQKRILLDRSVTALAIKNHFLVDEGYAE